MKKIAIIGGGWYGCHIARTLKLAGFDVMLFESNEDIFHGISGNFGTRLHVGPHYPRSAKTRQSCQAGHAEFINTYPELLVEHAYSIYALGERDADNEPPRVDEATFRKVVNENKNCREIDPIKWGYSELQSAFDIEEKSIITGNLLREKWKAYLDRAGVKVICNFKVQKLQRIGDKTTVIGSSCSDNFDYIVNTTSYQALLPPPELSLPLDLDIVYQPCLALIYEDKLSKDISLPPFSFIVMDGWFPCIEAYIEEKEECEATENTCKRYGITHSKFTIMGSFKTLAAANACLEKIDEAFIKEHVQPQCEDQVKRFWPLFNTERRFKYIGWRGTVLAKIKTNREFRGAVTFARDRVIYVVPGKVCNIFNVARETMALIKNENIVQHDTYQYIRGGTLDDAAIEITEAVDPKIGHTCTLQTYAEITGDDLKNN